MRVLSAALLSLALAAPASAQSLYGPGGLFLNPTASLPPRNQLTPSVLVLPQRHPSGAVRTWLSVGVDYGVTDDIEIGLTYLEVFNWKETPSFGGYAKFRVMRETDRRPAIAAGFSQLAFGDVDARFAFVAAQKRLLDIADRYPLTMHLGGMYIDELEGIERQEAVPYGGLEIGLNRHFNFAIEARAKTDGDVSTPWGMTLLYRPNEDWRFALTWSNTGQSTDPKFGFGAGLTLGSRR